MEIKDKGDKTDKAVWQFLPEPIDDEDARYLSRRWLAMLSAFRPNPNIRITRILHCGYMSKRGGRNNALRRRWFVLSTDRMVSCHHEFYSIVSFLKVFM